MVSMEMKRLFYVIKEVEPEDFDGETMDDLIILIDGGSAVIFRIKCWRQE